MRRFNAIAKSWQHSVYRMLLVFAVSALFGCAHRLNAGELPVLIQHKETVEKITAVDFLERIAQIVNLQTARVDMSALSTLGVDMSEADMRETSFTKVNGYPQNQNGIIALSYSREKGQLDERKGTRERVSVTFQPKLMCIDTTAVYTAWRPRIDSNQFSSIGFGAGRLSPSLQRDEAERDHRGNGPFEIIVKTNLRKSLLHRVQFSFDHQYYVCARSVTVEAWRAESE